jgi:hypothetical protein
MNSLQISPFKTKRGSIATTEIKKEISLHNKNELTSQTSNNAINS